MIKPSFFNVETGLTMKFAASVFIAATFATSGQPTAILWEGQTLSTVADVRPHEWLLALKAKTVSGENIYCTAVLVTPNVALTAGHCVHEISSIEVMAASSETAEFATVASAVSWEAHPQTFGEEPTGDASRVAFSDFRETSAHLYIDLGVVALDRRLATAPVRLSPPKLDPLVTPLTSYVFGRQRDEFYRSLPTFDVLRTEVVQWIGSSRNILAKLPKGRWCVRDSGGPVTAEGTDEDGNRELQLIGIGFVFFGRVLTGDLIELREIWGDLSAVPPCGERMSYVHVGYNLNWIRDAMDRVSPGSAEELQISQ